MKQSIHNQMFEVRLKEDVTLFFYDRIQGLVRKLLARETIKKVNTELAFWDVAARNFTVPHQMLLFIKRRIGHGRQLWLSAITEDILHLFDMEAKQYVDEKVALFFPMENIDEQEKYRLIVKVQRIIINNMDTAVFGIRTMSGR